MQLDFACLPGECLRSDSLIRCEGFVKNVICLDNLKRALDMRGKQCVFILGFATTIVTDCAVVTANKFVSESMIN